MLCLRRLALLPQIRESGRAAVRGTELRPARSRTVAEEQRRRRGSSCYMSPSELRAARLSVTKGSGAGKGSRRLLRPRVCAHGIHGEALFFLALFPGGGRKVPKDPGCSREGGRGEGQGQSGALG